MHDPMTQAFAIRYPWRAYPKSQRKTEFEKHYRRAFIYIWHVDPERGGSDDSCDWFGSRRPLNARERALWDALDDLFHKLGNPPYYPDRALHGPDPHGEDPQGWGVVGRAQHAMWQWRRRGWRLHPRWHVWHWRIQCVPLQDFKRWAFSRCSRCGGRFAFGESPISGSWYGTGPRWFRSEQNTWHQDCDASDRGSRPGPRARRRIRVDGLMEEPKRTLVDGSPVTPDHREIDPTTGMQKDYVVLSAEERAKGFVRPVRRSYRHLSCGTVTTMAQALAETYARQPDFYSGTFCAGCRSHFAVGSEGEFVWDGTDEKVGT